MKSYTSDWIVRAQCRSGDYSRWESDNRGRGQATEAVRACSGCPVLVNCARYALAHPNHNGMVWAGVPVPEMKNTDYYDESIRRLEILASLPTDDEL